MAGGDESVRDHRKWWSDLVSAVAYAPAFPRTSTSPAEPDNSAQSIIDEAPVASLVAEIGPANPSTAVLTSVRSPANTRVWLFAILAFALLAEVASRRSRGEA